jgi:hypothetical protein
VLSEINVEPNLEDLSVCLTVRPAARHHQPNKGVLLVFLLFLLTSFDIKHIIFFWLCTYKTA